jgi:hypothetical protein
MTPIILLKRPNVATVGEDMQDANSSIVNIKSGRSLPT